MSSTPTFGRHRDDSEFEQAIAIVRDAFDSSSEEQREFFESVGRDIVRVVRRNDQVVGALGALYKGQFFGGQSVSTVGISGVATAPEARAHGAATELMQETLREAHEAGTAISTLYPATVALYRRVGYEIAGVNAELTLPVRSIDLRDRTLEIRRATDDDDDAIQQIYRQYAAQNPGNIDRIHFNWTRVKKHGKKPTDGFVVCRDGQAEGYIYLLTETSHDGHWVLRVTDLAATTADAARRILTFLADYRTIRKDVICRSGPVEPIVLHLAEHLYTFNRWQPWMVRIVHLPNALTQRGYSPTVNAELHFDVQDPLITANHGRFVLRIEDGQAMVESGGNGTLKCDIRGLAAMYTGYLSAEKAALSGLADGDATDLARCSATFAGPCPWMRDAF